jgi:hypothetical protein
VKRENPAGTKIARAFEKAKKREGYGDGLRKLNTRNNLARMANKRKRAA